ncbi:hypothetical protein SAMN04488012_104199 [Palleronia salina]|uniref:Uncharacterized protein n=1 Tax=Palleronia salina TaxID=313368 RepID=A0A1M6G580_9RHOB|nr:hypothetical protein [Palleronia salina]SHJ04927.1 hypothetical protein SAMN04488012_104199 [Palleronia salina]
MSLELPEYFFRVRDNGAFVFRVDSDNRQRRIEMDQIAVVNIRNGEVKPNGERTLDEHDMAAITEWMEERRATLAYREIDDILRTVDHLNQTAHWVQTKATEEQIDAILNPLLLSMHDLRQVLVRKRTDRIMREREANEPE